MNYLEQINRNLKENKDLAERLQSNRRPSDVETVSEFLERGGLIKFCKSFENIAARGLPCYAKTSL